MAERDATAPDTALPATPVTQWLQALRLETYADAFREQGFMSLAALQSLTADDLDAMGIKLQGHRARILKHLPSANAGGSKLQPAKEDELRGLDAVLSDLAAIASELDKPLPAVVPPPTTTSAAVAQQLSPEAILADKELEALLADLCAFGQSSSEPAVEVVERFPAAAPEPQLIPVTAALPSDRTPTSTSTDETADSSVDSGTITRAAPGLASVRRNPDVQERLEQFGKRLSAAGTISQQDLDNLMKEEKIRIAMEKMANAQLQEVAIQVFAPDGKALTLEASLSETAFEIVRKLVVKNGLEDHPNWKIVEVYPELLLERHLEDHESVVEVFNARAPASQYRFELRNDPDKFALFVKTDKFFPPQFFADLAETAAVSSAGAEKAKRVLLQEFFNSTKRLPDIKGYVYDREGPKKWKKKFCVIRASGIYTSTKGESEASKDLQMLIKFSEHVLCFGSRLSDTYKAPTDFTLCFKSNIRKRPVDPSEIKAISCATDAEYNAWLAAVRLAMHGPKLKEAYDETLRKFDTLVQMGVTDASAKHALINRELDRMTSVKAKANTEQIRRWQTQRAAKDAPHISAATGVEFDVPEAGGGGFIAAVPADVASQPWFHGALERHHVDSFFTSGACPLGTFLVRSSTTQPGEFVLSALFNGQSYHYRIKQRKSSGGAATQWSLNETEVFESISDLVDYYRHPNKSLAGVLTTPLTRSSAVRL